MSIVINRSSSSKVTLTPSNQGSTSIVVKKSGGTLQSLSNVDSTELEDGYTLLYDAETNTWIASPVGEGVIAVDGGSY